MMTNDELLTRSAQHLALRFPDQWPALPKNVQQVLTHDLIAVWEEDTDATLSEAMDLLEDRLTAGNNKRDGVLARYGASIVRTYTRKFIRAAELKLAGFDDSNVFGENVRVRCSQCNASTINGVPCHESRCPNIVRA